MLKRVGKMWISSPIHKSRKSGGSLCPGGPLGPTFPYFLSNFKKFLISSYVRSRSGQMSKSSLFALSATETRRITAANTNLAKRHPKG